MITECVTIALWSFCCFWQSFLGLISEAIPSNLTITMIKVTQIFINIVWFQNIMLKKLKKTVMIRTSSLRRVILIRKAVAKTFVIWQPQISKYWKHRMKSIKYLKFWVCSSDFFLLQRLAKNIHNVQLQVCVKWELVVSMFLQQHSVIHSYQLKMNGTVNPRNGIKFY